MSVYIFIHRHLYNKLVYSMHCNIIMIISVFYLNYRSVFVLEYCLCIFPVLVMDTAALSILYTWIHNNDITFLQVIYKAWHIQVGVCTVHACVCVYLCTCDTVHMCVFFFVNLQKLPSALLAWMVLSWICFLQDVKWWMRRIHRWS